jgi:hypothetical protein
MTITNLLYGKRRKNSSMLQNIFKNVHHDFTAELGPGISIATEQEVMPLGEKTYAKSSPKVPIN